MALTWEEHERRRGLPMRLPGNSRQRVTIPLSSEAFARGYATLSTRFRMPTNPDAQGAFSDYVRGLSDIEFMESCKAAVVELDKQPTAKWIVDRATFRRRPDPVWEDDTIRYDGGWMFVCRQCGNAKVSTVASEYAPTTCRKCERGPVAYEDAGW